MSNPAEQDWGPGFIGLMVSMGLFGITIGQTIYYYSTFPDDLTYLKFLVAFVFVMDTVHVYAITNGYWNYLILSRSNVSTVSTLPWQTMISAALSYIIAFVVQSFYGQRIWIISGKKWKAPIVVWLVATTQLVLGMLTVADANASREESALFDSMYPTYSALSSVICDALIIASVVYYLRESRSGLRRTQTVIQQLILVFVNLGTATCLISFVTFVLYVTQKSGTYYMAATTTVMCKSYVNSCLALLNARKRIREQGQATILNSFELPTIDISSV